MRKVIYIFLALFLTTSAFAQTDRKEVRSGNRQFSKENYKEAEISYRRALVKDSLSVAANYNLANTLYRQEHFEEAGKMMGTASQSAIGHPRGSDCYFNEGDIALSMKNYSAAVEAFKKSLLLNPGDLQAKENYIYAKKMLEDQQQNGGGGGDQNQQDNQNGQNDQQNQGGQDNQDGQNDQKDQNDNQNQDGQNQRNPQDGQSGQQEVSISPQQAQQMLKAIQAKEKATQEKVNKEKAESLKSRQKEKNW